MSLLFFIQLFGLTLNLIAPSNVAVDVNDNIKFCEAGCTLLTGQITGNYLCYNWRSDFGYFNDSELSPFVCVNSGSETFIFTAYEDVTGSNLIVNPSFESGNTGFTTDYNYNSSLYIEGDYFVGTNPTATHHMFANCSAYDGAHFMILNGSANYSQIWCQTIAVEAYEKYKLSAWASSVISTSPAELQFAINGVNFGSILNLPSATCQWENLSDYWYADANITADICITNLNTASSGNDFVIDDLFFAKLCSDTAMVTVSVEQLILDKSFPDLLNCGNLDEALVVYPISPNPPYLYNWYTADGNIISATNTQTAIGDAIGSYTVTVTDSNNCTEDISFNLDGDFTPPNVAFNIPELLDCNKLQTDLFLLPSNPSYTYQWDGPGLVYIDEDYASVNMIGDYTVTVTDQNNFCTDVFSVTVNGDYEALPPNFNISNNISCQTPIVQIQAITSYPVSDYSWTGPEPNLNSINLDKIDVGTPGEYELTITYQNGCTAMNQILIAPPAGNCCFDLFSLSDYVICEPGTIFLQGAINGSYLDFSWTSDGGYFNDFDLNPSLFVDQTTRFTLMAREVGKTNLVTNGNFESGNIGFNSQYNFNPGTGLGGLGQGSYNLDVVTPFLWTNCPAIDGTMMVVNAATVPNVDVYCTDVPVLPNTDYVFTADIMNINNPPPTLQFSINGILLGTPFIGGAPCDVGMFYETWNSGSATNATICIVNQSTAASGNDFALDNIFFGEVCVDSISYTVTVKDFSITELPNDNIDCNQTEITIQSIMDPVDPTYQFLWSTFDGDFIGVPNTQEVVVSSAGNYYSRIASRNFWRYHKASIYTYPK